MRLSQVMLVTYFGLLSPISEVIIYDCQSVIGALQVLGSTSHAIRKFWLFK